MASSTEAEPGDLFENCQKSSSMRTVLANMCHQQPPTAVTMDNTAANSTVNGTEKQKILSNICDILLGYKLNLTKPFPHILGRGKEKPGRLCHKTPPDMAS